MSARFAPGAKSTDLFAEGPDALYVPLPKKVAVSADGEVRFEFDLTRGVDLAEFAGKTLRLTLVSDGGASEQHWQLK